MDVNYEVWGTPDTWVDGEDAQLKADIKFAASTNDTLGEAWTTGRVPWNTVDLSAAYWGISKDSMWAHPHQIWAWSEDGQTSDFEVGDGELLTQAVDIPAIFTVANTDISCPVSYSRRWKYRGATEQGSISGNAYTKRVFMDFNYQKVIIAPYVICKPADWAPSHSTGNISQGDNISFVDYFDNDGYVNRPQILGFGYRCWFGDGDTQREQTTSFGLVDLLIDAPGNSGYSPKIYFAGPDGASFATHNIVGWSVIPQDITFLNVQGDGTVGDSDTGLRWAYSPDTTGGSGVRFYYYDNDPLWEINKSVYVYSNHDYWTAYARILCTATNKEAAKAYAMKQIAYLGLPFVIDPETAKTGKIGDVGVYLPKFDEDGVTTGEYEEGENALTLPNAQWVDGRQGADYDPIKPPIRVPEDRGDIANVGASRRFRNPLKVWCLYNQNIDGLLSAINDIYQETADPDVQWQRDFQGSNPTDYIVGFYAILLNPPKTNNTQTFTLGPVDFDGSLSYYRYNFDAQNAGYFTFGTVALDGTGDYRPYGDFRDYAPYTQLEVYIPLCGTVELDPAYFVGHSIKIDMYYDIFTMSCVAAIYRVSSLGTTLYKTVNGTIGAQIPLLSRDMGTYQNTIKALESAHKQNENRLITSTMTAGIGAAITIGTGGAAMPALAGVGLGGMGLINTIEQGKLLDYQLDHTQPAIAQTGVAETQNSFCVGQLKAKINIKCAQPIENTNDAIYSNTVGNACCIATTVQYMSQHMPGLTICSDIKCGGIRRSSGESPTLEEINAIKQAFINGVYV